MISNATFIRQCLIEAGSKGVVSADTFRHRKENDVLNHKGTYASYCKLLQILRRLKWIEPTGQTETAHAKGNGYQLHQPRTFYKITSEGLARPEEDWSNPRLVLYPRPENYERKNYHKPKPKVSRIERLKKIGRYRAPTES